ncbi:uncharacterized protein LOC117895673 [Drosophila subobscura]|uniref:uncharacterized protein LOC117895673 n=1 Tax=Drosophila subobscura TaxID=7241 RepID=UPI00155A638B|nr:uncharacterized protein LOC117895673 [Drosophila subobscura]
MPLKCIIQCVHEAAHNIISTRPVTTFTRGGCRAPIKNGPIANAIFFAAIFSPLYVCLLKDGFLFLVDLTKKMTRE